jgi:hypothetical protein
MHVITIRDLDSRIASLRTDIDHEKNPKEKARLVDEQAALKLTRRVMRHKTAEKVSVS